MQHQNGAHGQAVEQSSTSTEAVMTDSPRGNAKTSEEEQQILKSLDGIDLELVQAYKLYLESDFFGGFLEYQLYLKGELKKPARTFPKPHKQFKQQGQWNQPSLSVKPPRQPPADTGRIAALAGKRERILQKMKQMSYVRDGLQGQAVSVSSTPTVEAIAHQPAVDSTVEHSLSSPADFMPVQPAPRFARPVQSGLAYRKPKTNKSWVRPGSLPKKVEKKIESSKG